MNKSFYITFGFGSPLKNYYIKVIDKTEDEARILISSIFKDWAGIYNDEEGKRIVEKHELNKLCIL